MAGKSFPEPWLVVDIKAKEGEDCFRHMPYFNFHCDPKAPTVSCPQPNGHHRFEFLLMPGQTKEQMEDPATVRALLARHIDVDKVEVLRRLVYTFNALVAERWRDGRVLLAGDAAHMTPQFMGQGMSSGVRDAHNLAWKLDAVLRAGADPKLIDTYESERKPHAKEMIDISVRMKNFVSLANPFQTKLRNVVVKTLLRTPKVGDYLREARFKPPPTYPQGAYFGLPRRRRKGAEGRPIPQPQVRTFDGRRALLDDILGEEFALVGCAADPRAGLDANTLIGLEALGARFVALYPYGGRPQGEEVPRDGSVERARGSRGPHRRRGRLVPQSRREERLGRRRPARQVRLRADAGHGCGGRRGGGSRGARQATTRRGRCGAAYCAGLCLSEVASAARAACIRSSSTPN